MLKLFNKCILVGVLSVLAGCATQKFSTGDPSPATVIQPAAIVKDYSDYAALGLVKNNVSKRVSMSSINATASSI